MPPPLSSLVKLAPNLTEDRNETMRQRESGGWGRKRRAAKLWGRCCKKVRNSRRCNEADRKARRAAAVGVRNWHLRRCAALRCSPLSLSGVAHRNYPLDMRAAAEAAEEAAGSQPASTVGQRGNGQHEPARPPMDGRRRRRLAERGSVRVRGVSMVGGRRACLVPPAGSVIKTTSNGRILRMTSRSARPAGRCRCVAAVSRKTSSCSNCKPLGITDSRILVSF